MSGTTRSQTEWKAGERRRDTSPTIAWAAWKGPKPSAGVGAGMGRQMATGSGVASTAFEWVHAGWDNAGVSFCVRLDPDGVATVRLVALHPLDLWNGEA